MADSEIKIHIVCIFSSKVAVLASYSLHSELPGGIDRK